MPALPPHPFIERSNQRQFAPDYAGDIFLWDIDKTYLDTHFSSVRGLFAIPFELAVDKEAVPGAAPLLRALRRGPGKAHGMVPLYFVSGSPPQLRRVVERKMTLDGVQFDGITFKDQWGFVRARRPRGVKEQVGYKLRALLLYRIEIGGPSSWYLFGDDAESDAEVFTLFGEVCAGLRHEALERRLRTAGVHADDIRNVHAIAEQVPVGIDPVARIFIHLYNRSDPARLTNERVVPTSSFLQTALVLADLGRVRADAITTVVNDLRHHARIPESTISAQIDDARTRLAVSDELCDRARL